MQVSLKKLLMMKKDGTRSKKYIAFRTLLGEIIAEGGYAELTYYTAVDGNTYLTGILTTAAVARRVSETTDTTVLP